MKKKNLQIEKKFMHQNEDLGFVDADKSILFLMVWEITRDLYFFIDDKTIDCPMNRNVIRLYRKKLYK